MGKVKFTEAKTAADLVKWVRDNKHFEGWWNGDQRKPESFSLRGEHAQIVIVADAYNPDLIEPDDFDATGHMFRPTAAGLAVLASSP
jgi:hypothetical protein